MKKGVVMDKEGSFLIVMSPDGSFHKTKKRPKMNADIGDEVEIKPLTKPFFTWIHSLLNVRNTVVVATVVLLAIIPFLYISQPNKTAYAYVNIDINPSVELTVNQDLEVIKLTALNDDGENIINLLQSKDWQYESVEKVTFLIIDTTEKEGFMQDDNDILVGVSYVEFKDKERVITEKISAYISQQENGIVEGLTTFEVPKTVHDKATEEKKSMNYLYAQELIMEQEEIEAVEENKEPNAIPEQNKISIQEDKNDVSEEVEKVEEKKEIKLDKGIEKAIIENFIEKVNEDDIKLPPGLVKKIQEYETINKEDITEQINEIINELEDPYEKEEDYSSQDHPSNKRQDFVPPGHNKKNDDDHKPPGHEKKEDEDVFIPPGLKKKLEDVEISEEELLNKAEKIKDELLNDESFQKYYKYMN